MKTYIIVAHTGQEIIDSTLEAQDRIAAMEYLEERKKRELAYRQKQKLARNPLRRLAALCGMV